MSNQKPKNEISESQLSWIFFIIFLQIYLWILILVPMAACGVDALALPLLGAAFSAIAIRCDPSESYLKISGNMNCINNFATPLGEVDSSDTNL